MIVPHELNPHSTHVFLGYLDECKGYQCLDLSTNCIIISNHVMFDESSFPFFEHSSLPSTNFDFLSKLNYASTDLLPVTGAPFTPLASNSLHAIASEGFASDLATSRMVDSFRAFCHTLF
jgi:hypothetical protein